MKMINKLTLGVLFTVSLFSQNSIAMEANDETLAGSAALAGSVSRMTLSETVPPELADEVIVKIATYINNLADLCSLSLVNHNFNEGLKFIKGLALTLTEEDNRPKLNLSVLPNLTQLSVHCTNPDYASYIKTFENLKTLTAFNLKISGNLTEDLIKAINNLTNLTSLDLEESLDTADIKYLYARQLGGRGRISQPLIEDMTTTERLRLKSNLSYLSLPSIKKPIFSDDEMNGIGRTDEGDEIKASSQALYNSNVISNIREEMKNLKVLKIRSNLHEVREIHPDVFNQFMWKLLNYPALQKVHILDTSWVWVGGHLKKSAIWSLLSTNNSALKIFGMVINGYPIEGESVKDIYNNFVKENEAA